MIISSPSFNPNEKIPTKFTCDGWDLNPELTVQNVPSEAKSLALIMEDPDAPVGLWTHWVVWNIDPQTSTIKEESVPPKSVEGKTSANNIGYHGPCPPDGLPHRYFFKLFALDKILNLKPGSERAELEQEMEGHVIQVAELMGIYER